MSLKFAALSGGFDGLDMNVQDPLEQEEGNVLELKKKKKKNKKNKKNKQKVASEKCVIDGYLTKLSCTFLHCVLLVSFANMVSTSGGVQIVEDNGGAVVVKPKKKKLKL